ncbi:enoyl-CoA hydratase/isomerase family protein [Nakamurella antarctica]|uniref:enoyl-CoA hydratase n=1 Tax=Nakamurella antarctica TaxID=1902245 RepID=A0A3G8ZV26_9ACTN|nr:enoyl-CoA hydratase-related protein [Nakamurella antarctica]AZI57866.1 enoyl-CoA hydratase/isomerase family protein [Nakamurella antarctica]
MTGFVRLEILDAVGIIRLDRPPVNAINSAMHGELSAAVRAAAQNPEVRAVVVYGGERAFAAGADIKEMASKSAAEMSLYGGDLTGAVDALARLAKPVIAAVTGYALGGGCEIALAADFRVVAQDSVLGLPEITLGVIPGAGGTQRLPRIVGVTKAKEMIFGGRPVTGVEAVAIGLASRAVPADQVYSEALSWAQQLARGATAAIAAAKLAIDSGLDGDIATGLRIEAAVFAGLFATEDQKTGMRSFIESGPGKATFSGR